MSLSEAKKIAKKYADTLKKNGITFSYIYLFGSSARGKAKKFSDIDVAVVIDHIGSGKNYLNKKMRLWELTPEVDVRIELVLLKKDLRKGLTIMTEEVKKYGIKIK